MPTDRAQWREPILAMSSTIAQRYTFARYVLRESRLASAAIAGAFQAQPMDEREYDYLSEHWSA